MRKLFVFCCGVLLATNVLASDAVERGKNLVQTKACFSCHGFDGKGTDDTIPNLNGQHARYFIEQMHAYRDKSRIDLIMAVYATSLSDAEISDLAAYYSSLP